MVSGTHCVQLLTRQLTPYHSYTWPLAPPGVIPANAGIQPRLFMPLKNSWIPVYTGMTLQSHHGERDVLRSAADQTTYPLSFLHLATRSTWRHTRERGYPTTTVYAT